MEFSGSFRGLSRDRVTCWLLIGFKQFQGVLEKPHRAFTRISGDFHGVFQGVPDGFMEIWAERGF